MPLGQHGESSEDCQWRPADSARPALGNRRGDVRRRSHLQRGGAVTPAFTMAALVVMASAGCGSSSPSGTPGTVPAGRTEWLFGAQAAGAIAPGAGAAPLPEIALAARRGFADRFEVQANGTMLPIKQLMTGSLEL